MSDTTTIAPREQRTVPLSKLELSEGHNPRGQVQEDAKIRALADNMKERGMLQPILVAETSTGSFQVVAGERRYHAAVRASLMQVPVILDHRPADHPELEMLRFEDAMSENLHQVSMSFLAIARGFDRQRRKGKRSIAEIAAMYPGFSRAAVRKHLQALDFSEALQQQIDTGKVPDTVIKTLHRLHQIHQDLPDLAVSRVLASSARSTTYRSALTWVDLNRFPLTIVGKSYDYLPGSLPDGVYEPQLSYLLKSFTLTTEASEVWAEIRERQDISDADAAETTIRFEQSDLKAAEALNAVHQDADGRTRLIVGRDVGDQLAGDVLARRLARLREQERAALSAIADGAAPSEASATQMNADAETAEERTRRERREKIEAELVRREAREQRFNDWSASCAHNERLGATVWRDGARITIDDRVIKILTAFPIGAALGDLAHTGARYGFPDWFTDDPERKPPRARRQYLDERAATERAVTYLAGATNAEERAGRAISLLIMSLNVCQDGFLEAHQERLFASGEGVPWKSEVTELVDSIAADLIGPDVLGPRFAAREKQRAEDIEDAKRKKVLLRRLKALQTKITKITEDELRAQTSCHWVRSSTTPPRPAASTGAADPGALAEGAEFVVAPTGQAAGCASRARQGVAGGDAGRVGEPAHHDRDVAAVQRRDVAEHAGCCCPSTRPAGRPERARLLDTRREGLATAALTSSEERAPCQRCRVEFFSSRQIQLGRLRPCSRA